MQRPHLTVPHAAAGILACAALLLAGCGAIHNDPGGTNQDPNAPIVVDQPGNGEKVSTPIHIEGTATVVEGAVSVVLTDGDGQRAQHQEPAGELRQRLPRPLLGQHRRPRRLHGLGHAAPVRDLGGGRRAPARGRRPADRRLIRATSGEPAARPSVRARESDPPHHAMWWAVSADLRLVVSAGMRWFLRVIHGHVGFSLMRRPKWRATGGQRRIRAGVRPTGSLATPAAPPRSLIPPSQAQ